MLGRTAEGHRPGAGWRLRQAGVARERAAPESPHVTARHAPDLRAPRRCGGDLPLTLLALSAPPRRGAGRRPQAADQRAILVLTVNQAPQGEVVVLVRPGDVLVEPSRARPGRTAKLRRTSRDDRRPRVRVARVAGARHHVRPRRGGPHPDDRRDARVPGHRSSSTSPTPRPEYTLRARHQRVLQLRRELDAGRRAPTGRSKPACRSGPPSCRTRCRGTSTSGFVRGLTNVSVDEPDRLRRWTLGDSLLPAEGLASGMLIGGVRVARDYGLDPVLRPVPDARPVGHHAHAFDGGRLRERHAGLAADGGARSRSRSTTCRCRTAATTRGSSCGTRSAASSR